MSSLLVTGRTGPELRDLGRPVRHHLTSSGSPTKASARNILAQLPAPCRASYAELDRLCQDDERPRVPPAVRNAIGNRDEIWREYASD